jgi:hypothetical protein
LYILDHFLVMPVNYGITMVLEIYRQAHLQLEAVGMATGLSIFTKTKIVYIKTGWELLSVRCKRRNLQRFL